MRAAEARRVVLPLLRAPPLLVALPAREGRGVDAPDGGGDAKDARGVGGARLTDEIARRGGVSARGAERTADDGERSISGGTGCCTA